MAELRARAHRARRRVRARRAGRARATVAGLRAPPGRAARLAGRLGRVRRARVPRAGRAAPDLPRRTSTPWRRWPTSSPASTACRPGDRVAILAANSPDWVVGLLGLRGGRRRRRRRQRVVDGRARRRSRSSACGRGSSSPMPSGRRCSPASGRRCWTSPTCPPSSPRAGRSTLPDVAPRRTSPRCHVHQRHDRAPQGRGALARNLLAVIEYHRYTDAMAARLGGRDRVCRRARRRAGS